MPGLTRTAARHSSFSCSTHSRAVHKSDSYARLSFSLPNRKRYKVHATTDRWNNANQAEEFPYRKRDEVTCDEQAVEAFNRDHSRFNTASGIRSHVTGLLRSL